MDTADHAIFVSIDTDGDGDAIVTRVEMIGWGHGLSRLAHFRGRTQADDGTINMVFDMFGRDISGPLDAAERAEGM